MVAKQYRNLPPKHPMSGPGGGLLVLAVVLGVALFCAVLVSR